MANASNDWEPDTGQPAAVAQQPNDSDWAPVTPTPDVKAAPTQSETTGQIIKRYATGQTPLIPDFSNKVGDFSQYGPTVDGYHVVAPPMELLAGISKTGYKTISQLSSIPNLTIGALTMGLGNAAEAGSATAASALDVVKAWFAGQMAVQGAKAIPGAVKTITTPGTTLEQGTEAAGNAAVPLAMAGGIVASGATEVGTKPTLPKEQQTAAEKVAETETVETAKPSSDWVPATEPVPVSSDWAPETAEPAAPTSQPVETVAPAEGPQAPIPVAASEPESAAPVSEVINGIPNPETYGIAARVSDARAEAGNIEPVTSGVGISAPESVELGRDLIEKGADPQAVLDQFTETNRLSGSDMAVVRAHGESLANVASDAYDEHGADSPEYDAAAKADSDWVQAIKPMQTEWSKIGSAQQGETEIDTGDFHSLRRAYNEATGQDFTPEQATKAQGIASGVTKATQAAADAQQAVFDFMRDMPRSIDNPDIQKVWNLAKEYVDGGANDYEDVRQKIATDTGLSVQKVTEMLTQPKGAREVTNDMYAKLSARRQMIQDAQNWLKEQQAPGWLQFVRKVPRAFFVDKIMGHGTVGMVTHAGINVFDPTAWSTYFPTFLDQFKLMGLHDKGAFHEMKMQELVRDPNFITARRAGLANDPRRLVDDYQSTWIGNLLNKVGITGNRGFDALKLFRQARFNQIWDQLPTSMKNSDQAKMIADGVNHATGVVKTPFREWANWTFFAPKLEGSRWAWMLGDPMKAGEIISRWDRASPAEQAFALREVRQKAMIAGTYLSLLAANQGLLTAAGSPQKINYTDPRRSDFLAFKAAGYKFGIISPMLGMVRLFANLLHAAVGTRSKFEQASETRMEEEGRAGLEYARGKLSPFASFGADVAGQADFQGRPLPFSSDKVPPRLRRQGITTGYTPMEYASQEFTPIPISEAIHDVWSSQGMSESEIQKWTSALATAAVMGSTGARMNRDVSSAPATPVRTPKLSSPRLRVPR